MIRPYFAAISPWALLVMTSLTAASCSGPNPPPPPEPARSVVLIVIDTLREDTLGCYGAARNTSPFVDQLAENGSLFEGCVAQSNWTVPATASLLTSLYPTEHGAELTGDIRHLTGKNPPNLLPDEVTTLAEILRENGFATGLYSANPYLQAGMKQGFNDVVIDRISATDLNDRAIEWLEENAHERFYLHVQYIDIHVPVTPPIEYATVFAEPGDDMTTSSIQGWEFLKGSNAVGPDFEDYKRRRVALYDGTMRYIDMEIERLVNSLSKLGAADSTVVVVTSDHGEELWEHAEEGHSLGGDPRGVYGVGHGHAMYDESIRVPLIFSGKGIPTGLRSSAETTLLDVSPTVLDVLGIAVPKAMRGRSLAPLFRDDASSLGAPSIALVESPAYGPDSKAIIADGFKLILRSDGQELLFDLRQDPGEERNIAQDNPETAKRLKQMLQQVTDDLKPVSGSQSLEVDATTEAHLRELGYVE